MRCFQDLHTFRWPRIADSRQTLREANELVLKSTIRSKRNAECCFGGRSKRLCYLKEAGGLTFERLHPRTGAWTPSGCAGGAGESSPPGGAMLSILRFASRVPGGVEMLMGEGFHMTLFREAS